MSAARRRDPKATRTILVDIAEQLFAENGVADTAVSDIVRKAGVAQGTFYLYFKSKEDAANAVVERMTAGVVQKIEQSVGEADLSALAKLDRIRQAFSEMTDEPHEQEILALFHRPENMAFHDQMMRGVTGQLAPVIAVVIEQGVAEGVFRVSHPLLAAHAILSALQLVDTGSQIGVPVEEVIGAVVEISLRILGYEE